MTINPTGKNSKEEIEDINTLNEESLSEGVEESTSLIETEIPDSLEEITIPKTQESEILGRIDKYRSDYERERGDGINPSSNTQSSTDDGVLQDDNDDSASPINYFGYEIPGTIFDSIKLSSKLDPTQTESWLQIFCQRLAQKLRT